MRVATFLRIALACVTTMTVTGLFAQPSTAWKRSTRHISKTDTPPKIDGSLDDPCWKTATHADEFFRFQSDEPVHEKTEAWICADKTRLYFGFHCYDTKPELIKAHETQREGDINHDDIVGVAIDSQFTHRNCSQFTVSARGTQLTQLEGGTAENLTWAGDWTAATKRTADGWTAEISIPYALLRYPKGAKSFGLVVIRQLARETNIMLWPRVPKEGFSDPLRYMDDFNDVDPPYYAPRLVGLPYVLGVAGEKSTIRGGLDLKYPISTSITGVATLFPDFATVEQAVNDLSFSYTEKFLPDHRPFFAEGSNFLNDQYLFYSQRIPSVDAGLKVIGKEGNSTVSLLSTTANQSGQTAYMANVSQDIGAYGKLGFAALGNNIDGQPSNRVYQVNGNYGWAKDGRQVNLTGNYTGSSLSDGTNDHASYLQLNTDAGRGKINGNVFVTETGPKYANQLGYVPEVDLRGKGFNIFYYNNLDRGRVERINWGISGDSFRHMTGGFFHDSLSFYSNFQLRSGYGFNLSGDVGKRDTFRDNTISGGFSWNQKSLFDRGGVNFQVGHRQNMPYNFASLSQGILLTKPFSLQLSVGRVELGSNINTQTILSGTYRLNPQETFGARLVQQDSNVNLYLSYGRRTRHGTDIFLLVGDPNTPKLQHKITLKLVRPF